MKARELPAKVRGNRGRGRGRGRGRVSINAPKLQQFSKHVKTIKTCK